MVAAVAGLSSLPAGAQTIAITNGVQKYAALTGATINMSGKCELWVTNASPLSGCTINLNSGDTWLFLPGVKPSVTAAMYLGQVKVNGAAAVADGNVRVVQYGQNGAVVIPQPSSFRPLTAFTGAEFTGAATQYGQWTYYTGGGIANIRSFKLKRGYQAVFAQSADGKHFSQCYVAQDGDLEIGALPSTLDKQVQFIYVTLWRWTGKKGIAGNPGIGWLNVLWWYDWNIDQNSSRDLEYMAIRQNQSWPSLNQNWQSLGVNTLLGYNEPDQVNQANLTVSQAISSWGDLLATGLRVGSPATSDAGPDTWLIPFVQQAAAAALRVDFVCTHYYQAHDPTDPAGCASQMFNFLLNIWNNTHRPIWVTEWNNGANWTDNNPWPVPTYAQQQACIAAMENMLETTPFVERYALYNWVEDNRSLVTSTNTVTLAGTVYSNTVSGLSYSQAMPDNGTRGIAEFLFATNTWDSSGYYNNGMAVGAPAYAAGHNSQAQAIVLDGANSFVQLPANVASGGGFTFAAWVCWNGGAAWQRIFDFGNDTSQYLFLTPNSGGGTLRFAITTNGNGAEQQLNSTALTTGAWTHVAVTLNGSAATLYVNGTPVAVSNNFTIAPSDFSPVRNFLCKSQFSADPLYGGKLDEVEIADYAMTPAQIFALYTSAPYPAYTGGVWTNDADGNWSAGGNWSGGMIANGGGFIADFSTLNTTADRTVTLDSARAIGGLRFGNPSGSQNWILTGANTLTLDGGGANPPTIAVNQNTATISTALAGSSGFTKTGGGKLTLNGNNTVGGGLSVNAGSVNITAGATAFGNVVSYVGYLTGSGNLTVSNANLTMGELRVAGSDQSGSAFNAQGTVALTSAVLSLGALTLARGNYLDNSVSGTLTMNGGSTVVSTNDVIVEFAGMGRGTLVINGGNFIIGPAATKWFMVGYYDTGGGELDINGGNLFLENGSSLKMCRSGNTGGNVVNQNGGAVTFFSDAGLTIGGGGNLDLDYAGAASSSSTYNLNGGTLTVPQVTASSSAGVSQFNFNGGTLKPAASNASFMQGLTAASVRNGGAIIDTAGFSVTIGQTLQHSTVSGDNPTDGGLTKNGGGRLILSGANSYTGNTTVSAGALELAQATLAANSTVSITNGAVLQLDFASTNQIGALVLNGVAQLPGVYNRNTAPAYITGAGSLVVPPGTFTNAPVITNFALNGPNLVITCVNGQAGCAYYLLGSTDLTLPFSQWQPVATNVLNAGGGFAFTGTNVATVGNQPQFFILSNTNR
jgi:autotransporter-associated beta strand protein